MTDISSKEIISNNTKFQKHIVEVYVKHLKYWWNETDDETLPVFAQFLWTLKFISLTSQGKLFLVLLQATIILDLKLLENANWTVL